MIYISSNMAKEFLNETNRREKETVNRIRTPSQKRIFVVVIVFFKIYIERERERRPRRLGHRQ